MPMLALGLSLAAGCTDRRTSARIDDAGPAVRGGTLEVVGSGDVDHLNPMSAATLESQLLVSAFSRQLLAYPLSGDDDTRTRPVPDLALEEPTHENGGVSADGLTYTFRLRRGVQWDTDPPREVTAHDFVRAFKLFCNPVTPVGNSIYAGTIAGLDRYCDEFSKVPRTTEAIRTFIDAHPLVGVEATDAYTVVFRLTAPAADFPRLIAATYAAPVPIESLDDLPDSPAFRQHTRSIGPYRIVRYIQNREYLLERNPVWSSQTDGIRAANVDRIHVRLGFDQQLQQLQIDAGSADLSYDRIPTAAVGTALALDASRVLLAPGGRYRPTQRFLVFNRVGCAAGGALNDRRVRQAIALAVDKAALVQLTGGPRVAAPLRQAVSTGSAGYRDGGDREVTPGDRGDPEAARRLLAAAGYANGLRLRLAHPDHATLVLYAQSLQASLARVGIDLTLMLLADDTLIYEPDAARRGAWDFLLRSVTPEWYGPTNGRTFVDPFFNSREFRASGGNAGGYASPRVDAGILRIKTAPTVDVATRAAEDVVGWLADDVAFVPLVETKSPYAISGRVRGCAWSYVGLNCDFTALWLADAATAPKSVR